MHGDQAVRCKITGKQCEFKQSSDECSQFAVKNVLKLNKCQIAHPTSWFGDRGIMSSLQALPPTRQPNHDMLTCSTCCQRHDVYLAAVAHRLNVAVGRLREITTHSTINSVWRFHAAEGIFLVTAHLSTLLLLTSARFRLAAAQYT